MPWQPMSISTPPPDRSTSQNQSAWGPKCFSLDLTRYTRPKPTLVGDLLRSQVFRSEEQFLGVHEKHALTASHVSIMKISLSHRHAQGLLTDDVLARACRIDRQLAVSRRSESRSSPTRCPDPRASRDSRTTARYTVPTRQILRVAGGGRSHSDHLGFVDLLDRGDVDIGLKLRADDTDLDPAA